jgi:type I restriction enzyme S subunit
MRKGKIKKNDVLVVKDGATTGKTSFVGDDFPFSEAAVNEHVFILRASNVILPKYLFYWFQSPYGQECIEDNFQGTAQGGITSHFVENSTFPLAPLYHQECIVGSIESLLTQLDAGVAELKRAQAALKRYKSSLLKAACEGRIGDSGIGGRDLCEGELPDGWHWVKSKEICEFITKGTTPKADKLFTVSGEIPFIKVYNLTFDGTLDFSKNPTFVSKQTHKGELARSKVFPGDVLMNIVGPPLGKVSIVPETNPEWNINQAIARFRPLSYCDANYLAMVLLSDNTLKWATKRAKATAGQFNLTLEICRELPIPLPPIAEQYRIVAEMERRLSVAHKMEQTIEANLKRASRLRQAILKRAFEGRLL